MARLSKSAYLVLCEIRRKKSIRTITRRSQLAKFPQSFFHHLNDMTNHLAIFGGKEKHLNVKETMSGGEVLNGC